MKTTSLIAAALMLSATSAFAQEPIKIGFISTFSGPSGQLGQELLDGFKLGLKSVGDKLGGRAVEIIQGDDQTKPDVGRQLADKMVESDRVQIITGINFSNVMLAVAKPVLDSGAFVFSINAGPSQYAGKLCHPHYFNESFQNDTLPEAMGIYLRENGLKRAGVDVVHRNRRGLIAHCSMLRADGAHVERRRCCAGNSPAISIGPPEGFSFRRRLP